MGDDRRVGVAVDFSSGSTEALRWTVDNLVRKGDSLILICILPNAYYEEGEMQLWETTGSPFIPLTDFASPVTMKKYGVTPGSATLDIVNKADRDKEIMVLAKIYWGDPREKLIEAIDTIPLTCLVMGSRGLGTIKRAIMGSVSNYVVSNASCPVTVVKHSPPK